MVIAHLLTTGLLGAFLSVLGILWLFLPGEDEYRGLG